jgi:hypothetical protein
MVLTARLCRSMPPAASNHSGISIGSPHPHRSTLVCRYTWNGPSGDCSVDSGKKRLRYGDPATP